MSIFLKALISSSFDVKGISSQMSTKLSNVKNSVVQKGSRFLFTKKKKKPQKKSIPHSTTNGKWYLFEVSTVYPRFSWTDFCLLAAALQRIEKVSVTNCGEAHEEKHWLLVHSQDEIPPQQNTVLRVQKFTLHEFFFRFDFVRQVVVDDEVSRLAVVEEALVLPATTTVTWSRPAGWHRPSRTWPFWRHFLLILKSKKDEQGKRR